MDDEQKVTELANVLFSKGLAASLWDAKVKAKDILGFSTEMIEKSSSEVEKQVQEEKPIDDIMNDAGIDVVDVKKAEDEKIEEVKNEFQQSLGEDSGTSEDLSQPEVEEPTAEIPNVETEPAETTVVEDAVPDEIPDISDTPDTPDTSTDELEPEMTTAAAANPESSESQEFSGAFNEPVVEESSDDGISSDTTENYEGTASVEETTETTEPEGSETFEPQEEVATETADSETMESNDDMSVEPTVDASEETMEIPDAISEPETMESQEQTEEISEPVEMPSTEQTEEYSEVPSQETSTEEPNQEAESENSEEMHIEESQIMNGNDDMVDVEEAGSEPQEEIAEPNEPVEMPSTEQNDIDTANENDSTDTEDKKGDYVYFGGSSDDSNDSSPQDDEKKDDNVFSDVDGGNVEEEPEK